MWNRTSVAILRCLSFLCNIKTWRTYFYVTIFTYTTFKIFVNHLSSLVDLPSKRFYLTTRRASQQRDRVSFKIAKFAAKLIHDVKWERTLLLWLWLKGASQFCCTLFVKVLPINRKASDILTKKKRVRRCCGIYLNSILKESCL